MEFTEKLIKPLNYNSGLVSISITPRFWPLINNAWYSAIKTQLLRFEIINLKPVQSSSILKTLCYQNILGFMKETIDQLADKEHRIILHVTSEMMLNRELYIILSDYPKICFVLLLEQSELQKINRAKVSRFVHRYKLNKPELLLLLTKNITIPDFTSTSSLTIKGFMLSKEMFWEYYQQNKLQLGLFIDKLVSRYSTVIVDGVDNEQLYSFIRQHQAKGIGHYAINDEIKTKNA